MRRARAVLVAAGLAVAAVACGGSSAPPPVAAQPPLVAPPPPEEKALPDRSRLPEPLPPPDWAPPVPQLSQLSNGMRVWYVEQGPTPLITVLVAFPRGSATDPVGKSGLTELMADMLDEGVPGMGALEVADALKNLATDYGPSVDVDQTSFYMNLLADTLDPSIELLSRFLREPTLPRDEFERRKEHRIAAALSGEAEPTTVRSLVLRRALYGQGYNGFTSSGTRPTLQAITHRDVKRHYEQLIAPEGAEIVVVGGVPESVVVPVLEKHLGGLTGKPQAQPRPAVDVPAPHAVHLVDFPDAAQSALAIATVAPPMDDPDYFPALVYNRIWGGAFTSRVNMNLREDKGYTYGSHSAFQRYRRTGMFVMATKVKTEATRASIDETFDEVRAVCGDRPLTAEERLEAVSGLLLGFPGRFQTINNVAFAFSTLPVYDRPADWYEKWPDRMRAVQLDDAQAVARKYCDPKQFEVVLIGDRAKVEPTLEGLGMPIIAYDRQGNLLR